MATITIKNVDRLTRKLTKLSNIELNDAMNDALKIVHGQAKSLAPVNKRGGGGTLAGSIHMDKKKTADGLEGRVYTNMEYAPYVEFGTGIKGDGTYPYKIKGLNLTYKDKGWVYWSENDEKYIYTTGQVAQPFMYPALKDNEKLIVKKFKNGAKNEIINCCKGGN